MMALTKETTPVANEYRDTMSEARSRLFEADAGLRAALADKGDQIAKKKGYGRLDGLDAVHRYLIDKHHWLPSEVRALTTDDLSLLLAGDPLFDDYRAVNS